MYVEKQLWRKGKKFWVSSTEGSYEVKVEQAYYIHTSKGEVTAYTVKTPTGSHRMHQSTILKHIADGKWSEL